VRRYLLDTNIISDFIRNPAGRVAMRVSAVGDEQICTSIIVAAEMRYGVAKGASPRIAQRVEQLLETIEILPFGPPADIAYGSLRARLERIGKPISENDLLIAAHAITAHCTLVTANEREFGRIGELPQENWLR